MTARVLDPGSLVARLLPEGAALPPQTEEEVRNIETILKVRRAAFEERRRFQAPGFVRHRSGFAHLHEHAAHEGRIAYNADSIADREDEILEIIARGDRVWAVWALRGTHTGELCGIPATGRNIDVIEMGIWRLVEGKIIESWFFGDELGLLKQLGQWPVSQE